jgi:hypothetical protein
MRTRRRLRAPRIVVVLLAGSCLLLATPPSALAREKDQNLWTQWWEGATNREDKLEIPFIFLASLPAMLIITPIWLVQGAYGRLTSEGDDGSQ